MFKRKVKKIALFFNGDRGISVYKKLINKYEITLILTNSKKIKEKFKKNIIFSKNINEERTHKLLKKKDIDMFESAGFSNIFKKKLLVITE